MPTIKDIAKEAGVSHGTVSNVLNKTGKVSIEKIQLVEAAAKKLGYTYNLQAKMLRKGEKDQIAIILPNLLVDSYRDLYDSISKTLFSENINVILYTTDDIQGFEEEIIERIPLSSVALIIAVSCCSKAFTEYKPDCPVILVNRNIPNSFQDVSFMSFDFDKAGKDIAGYIQKSSFKSVAFFSSSTLSQDEILLYQSLSKQLESANISIRDFNSDTGLATNKAFSIIQDDNDYDIIITSNPHRANAISTAIRFLKPIRKPCILTLASYQAFANNHYITYELDYKHMGATIAKKALSYMQHGTKIDDEIIFDNSGFRFVFPHIKTKENRTLSMLTLLSPSSEVLQKLAPNLSEVTGINLEITGLPYEDLYSQVTALDRYSTYDLIRMDVAWFSDMARKVYHPLGTNTLQSDIYKNLYMDNFRFYTHVENIAYGLPFDPSVQILLYRKDLFEDATLKRAYYEMYKEPLEVPTNFAQYNRVASFFTHSKNPLSPVTYGTASTTGTEQIAACDFMPRMLYELKKTKKGRVTNLKSRPILKALNGYLEVLNYTDATSNHWWGDTIRHFSEGNCAMIITFSNHAPQIINSKYSNVVGKIGAAPVPGGIPLLGGGVIGISKYSDKIEVCNQFFRWYYNKEIASLIAMLGGASPHIEIFNNFEIITQFPWLNATRESFKVGVRKYNSFFDSKLSDQNIEYLIGVAVLQTIYQSMNPKEALGYAQKLYEQGIA